MWRQTDDHAVLYTNDRATLDQLLSYRRFPKDASQATTYTGKNGRVYAWQFTVPASLWNGLVRHLGRESFEFLDADRPRSRREPDAEPPIIAAIAVPAPPAVKPDRAPRKGEARREGPAPALTPASAPGRHPGSRPAPSRPLSATAPAPAVTPTGKRRPVPEESPAGPAAPEPQPAAARKSA